MKELLVFPSLLITSTDSSVAAEGKIFWGRGGHKWEKGLIVILVFLQTRKVNKCNFFVASILLGAMAP